jgi:WXG100 family type VII secretion target
MANVNVTYQDMSNAARTLTKSHQEIESMLSSMKSMVDQLVHDGFVTDSASKQFEQSYSEFTKGASQVVDGLNGMSGYLNTASETFKQVDEQLAKALK